MKMNISACIVWVTKKRKEPLGNKGQIVQRALNHQHL